MSSRFQRGASDLDGIIVIAFLLFIVIVNHGISHDAGALFSVPSFSSGTHTGTTIRAGSVSSGEGASMSAPPANWGEVEGRTLKSAGYPSLSITSGNAANEIQSYREYIIVSNWSGAPIDITGWTLRNGKDKRTYSVGDQLQRFSADIARIPQAAPLLLPTGTSLLQDVVLKNGERAIITTGVVSVTSPYKITSFKENMCTGYLEKLEDYSFQPALQTNCPDPSQEVGADKLDNACRDFLQSLSSCTTPDLGGKDKKGDTCETCVNGKRLSSSCAAYVKEHFSYQGCLAYHAGDPNFSSGKTWRIFLGRTWEMWAKHYETIELFDRLGNLATFANYR